MAGFVHTTAHGQLTVGTVDLMCPAWRVTNLAAVMGAANRGSSVLIPTVTGRRSRKRRVDELVVALEGLVTGAASSEGSAATDVWEQLSDNIVALRAIAVPPDDYDGWDLTYETPGGDTLTASGWVESFEVSPDAGAFSRFAFDLVIPSGGWS